MNLKTNEQGRSMVEMLGVLAIIGVLSVSGIAGYTYAMNKYRANEIINEAYKRASVVAMQLAAGHTPNLGEFGDSTVSGVSFELEEEESIAGHDDFVIYVSGMDKSVCKTISNTIGGTPLLNLLDEDGGDIDCDNIENSSVGFLYDRNLLVGADSSSTVKDDSLGEDASDITQEEPASKSCTSNVDCKSGEYCQFSPSSATESGSNGKCQSVSKCGNGGTYSSFFMSDFSGECKLDWWTAQNWCSAKGGHMVSLTEIGCSQNTGPCSSATLSAIRHANLSNAFWTTNTSGSNVYYMFNGYSIQLSGKNGSGIDVLCKKD